MLDDRDHLIALIVSINTAMGNPIRERSLKNLSTTDLHRSANALRLSVATNLNKHNKLAGYSRIEGKLGKIILDGLNHDIPVLHAIKAFLRFFKHDFRESRQMSRLKRVNVNAQLSGPKELAPLLLSHGIQPVKLVISRVKSLRSNDPVLAGEYALSIISEEMSDNQTIFIAFTLYQGGNVTDAANTLEGISLSSFNQSQMRRRDRILSESAYLVNGVEIIVEKIIEDVVSSLKDVDQPKLKSNTKFKMAYVAASTLPHNKVGYTTRTHRVVSAIDKAAVSQDAELVVVARPGFPFDRFDLDIEDLGDKSESVVDNICYRYLKTETPMQASLIDYSLEAAHKLTQFFIKHKIQSVTAASNHVNALPAYIAARALDLPFTYEVRGLWEETKASRLPGWDNTDRFKVDRMSETFLVQNADNTFFITRQMKELFFPPDENAVAQNASSLEAIRLTSAKLAPNCAVVDDSLPVLQPYSGEDKDVLNLVYIGSLVEYEGLQLLITTLSKMDDKSHYNVTIVGAGNYGNTLRDLTEELGLSEIVKFKGRVDPTLVTNFYDMADIVLIPRLPYRVCQLVSPLKPLEAMSYKRICLASNVAPIADLITDQKTGFLFEAGDTDDLAKTLRHAYKSQRSYPDIADNAFKYVIDNRDWRDVGENIFTTNLISSNK